MCDFVKIGDTIINISNITYVESTGDERLKIIIHFADGRWEYYGITLAEFIKLLNYYKGVSDELHRN